MKNADTQTPPRSFSFVLRFWEERSAETEPAVWRFSIHDTQSGARRGFRDPSALLAFLHARIIQAIGAEGGNRENET